MAKRFAHGCRCGCSCAPSLLRAERMIMHWLGEAYPKLTARLQLTAYYKLLSAAATRYSYILDKSRQATVYAWSTNRTFGGHGDAQLAINIIIIH